MLWFLPREVRIGMDIQLTRDGDIELTKDGDIRLTDSVAQKIRIRILWFAGEWQWDIDEGLPWREDVFTKNPDTDAFEAACREKIFEVDEVTDVNDVLLSYDSKTRKAVLKFTALTDEETIREEVALDV